MRRMFDRSRCDVVVFADIEHPDPETEPNKASSYSSAQNISVCSFASHKGTDNEQNHHGSLL